MPGYLYEALTPQLDPAHFRMLRLAILRRLSCEQVSTNVFRVSSSREGHPPYLVDVEKGCPCDATSYCSHYALAVDRWHQWEADTQTRLDYFAARRLDFGGLCVRPGLCGDERRFVRTAVGRVAERFEAVTEAPSYTPAF